MTAPSLLSLGERVSVLLGSLYRLQLPDRPVRRHKNTPPQSAGSTASAPLTAPARFPDWLGRCRPEPKRVSLGPPPPITQRTTSLAQFCFANKRQCGTKLLRARSYGLSGSNGWQRVKCSPARGLDYLVARGTSFIVAAALKARASVV